MEQEDEMRKTLTAINESLTEGRVTMQNLALSLAATTKLAMDTDKALNGHVKFFQGAAFAVGLVLTTICWILLEKNAEIKKLTEVAITNQQELKAERAARDIQIEGIAKELSRQSTTDVRVLDALIKSLDQREKHSPGK